jgi:hypothetical protein
LIFSNKHGLILETILFLYVGGAASLLSSCYKLVGCKCCLSVWWMFFETIPTCFITSFEGVGTIKHLPKYQVYELALTSGQSKISLNESLENAR